MFSLLVVLHTKSIISFHFKSMLGSSVLKLSEEQFIYLHGGPNLF